MADDIAGESSGADANPAVTESGDCAIELPVTEPGVADMEGVVGVGDEKFGTGGRVTCRFRGRDELVVESSEASEGLRSLVVLASVGDITDVVGFGCVTGSGEVSLTGQGAGGGCKGSDCCGGGGSVAASPVDSFGDVDASTTGVVVDVAIDASAITVSSTTSVLSV